MSENQRKKEFETLIPTLRQELTNWHREQAELEKAIAEPADGGGDDQSTNIWNTSTGIDSLEVVTLILTVEAKMNFNIPQNRVHELIHEGGYADFQEMENDLIPKFERIYVAGGLPEKTKAKEEERAE